MRDTLERMASLLATYDIDEDICKKVRCNKEDGETYDCVNCIINFFSKPCKWNLGDDCTNNKSELCDYMVDNVRCGVCKYYEG